MIECISLECISGPLCHFSIFVLANELPLSAQNMICLCLLQVQENRIMKVLYQQYVKFQIPLTLSVNCLDYYSAS